MKTVILGLLVLLSGSSSLGQANPNKKPFLTAEELERVKKYSCHLVITAFYESGDPISKKTTFTFLQPGENPRVAVGPSIDLGNLSFDKPFIVKISVPAKEDDPAIDYSFTIPANGGGNGNGTLKRYSMQLRFDAAGKLAKSSLSVEVEH